MGKDVIIACDFAGKKEVFDFLDKFTDEKPYVKIGMELFYAEGPEIVREIKRRGHKIFLDLKLCDIPNTVRKSMSVLICGSFTTADTEIRRVMRTQRWTVCSTICFPASAQSR